MNTPFDKAPPATFGEALAIRRRFKESRRYAIFLWRVAIEQNKFNLNDVNYNNPDRLIELINIDMGFMNLIRNLQSSLLPDEEISFISDRKRLLMHLEGFLNYQTTQKGMNPIFCPLMNLSQKERLISNIDAWQVNYQEKLDFISTFKTNWASRIDNDSVYKFFKTKDRSEKIKYLLDWIKSRKFVFTYQLSTYNLDDEDYIEMFFESNFNSIESIELTINKFKRAWSNKNYRENLEGKKQCNISLDENCIKILDDLSKKYSYSKAEILQFLLLGEKKHGFYIERRLKEVQLLSNP